MDCKLKAKVLLAKEFYKKYRIPINRVFSLTIILLTGFLFFFSTCVKASSRSLFLSLCKIFICTLYYYKLLKQYKITAILSPCAGTVVYTTYEKSAGNYIVIKSDQKDPLTGKPLMLGFMHMKNFPTLKKNSRVTKGTVLGQVGSTGESTGPHLHLNIWTDANNVWATINTVVNPQKYFPNIQFTGETSNAD